MTTDTARKIVHLSSVHPATDTRILHKECRSLAKAGFDVTLIARAESDGVVDGVRIRAVSVCTSNRLVRMTRTVLDVARMALDERGDAYHFHDPELIPLGVFLKLRRKRVVYDVHENLAKQILSKYWIPGKVRKPLSMAVRVMERLAARFFDGIVAATPSIGDHFPTSKTVVVQNFALLEEFLTIDPSDYETRDRRIAYVGGITRTRGAEEMVRVMDRLDDVRLSLAGSFQPPTLEHELEQLPGHEYVDSLGWVDRQGVRDVLAKSRVGLLLLHPEPNYLDSYPVKLFEYMAAGLPVVASDFPFWRQFVADIGVGIMVDPHDIETISRAIGHLLNRPGEAREMGERGRAAVLSSYSWEQQAKTLVSFYRTRILD
jgi:glycosyltransferase involved in cell wall biosynthesis